MIREIATLLLSLLFVTKSLGELEDFVQTVRVEGGEGVRERGEGGGAAVILILVVVGS